MNKDAIWYAVAGLCVVACLLLLVSVAPGKPTTAQASVPHNAEAATTPQSEAILAALRLMALPPVPLYLPVILR